MLPILENRWIGHETGQIVLVISLKKNRPKGSVARHQTIDDFSRGWAAINVVAKIYFNSHGNRTLFQIRINALQRRIQKIHSAVDIADSVYANAIGHLR